MVRLRHPRGRPDQFARQGEEVLSVVEVKPIEERIDGAVVGVCRGLGRGGERCLSGGLEWYENAVHVEEDQL